MQQASSDVVRRAGIEPACLSATVFETDSYTCSGTCAYGTRRETRTPMPSRTPVPETGVSANSTSRAYWYAERESNSQARYERRPLRPMCLPFHHLRILTLIWKCAIKKQQNGLTIGFGRTSRGG